MAGDWIKMRADLHTHPKVVRISSALKADRLRVIGGLHAVWCLFDVHSDDGNLEGYSTEALDDLIGWPGFSNAMMAVGWIEKTVNSLVAPRFDEHNGQSAKRRAQETVRKRMARSPSASDADKLRSREEKRREEVNHNQELRASTDSGDITPAQSVCARLLKSGIKGVNPTNPKLIGLLQAGITEAEFCDLAEEPNARGKGLAWILAAIEGRRRDAAAKLDLPAHDEKPKRVCDICGHDGIKRVGQTWYCGNHDHHSEKVALCAA